MMIIIIFIVTPIILSFTIFKFGTFEIKVRYRDVMGIRPDPDPYPFLRIYVLKN